MKALNSSKNLWSTMSAKELQNVNFAAACCLNVQVTANQPSK